MGLSSSKDSETIKASMEFIDEKIAGKKVVVFSKSYCPYCTNAKKALQNLNIPSDNYEVIELENLGECDTIQDALKQKTGARSVPRVFVDGKFIGGGDETVALAKSGKLQTMLKDCGAI